MVRPVGRGLDPSAGGCPGDGRWREVSRGVGDAAPYGLPGMGGGGRLPLIRPCGATFPQGGRQGLLLAAAGGRGGVGAPRPTDGDMETLWGLRGHPFPGRRAVGAGHARPGGLRRQASMVRPVGRGLDPSAGGCPGDGRWRESPRGVGDAAPYGLPGTGGDGSLPLIRPCGATFPRGGRQGLLLAAAQASPYLGSWSSVRSWRVRL